MSHWAEIDENSIVIRVTVGDNNDPAGDEGYQWLIDNLGGTWIKTSYNGNIRKNYACVGFMYREDIDAFVAPQPYQSWTLDAAAKWQPPWPMPTDGKIYSWNEKTQEWETRLDFCATAALADRLRVAVVIAYTVGLGAVGAVQIYRLRFK